MAFTKSIAERKIALDAIYNDTGFYACLITGDLSSYTFTASGATLTATGHTMVNGMRVQVSTTGSLPTGLSTNTTYYVVSVATNTFGLSATKGGSAITTSGAGSGTHTVTEQPLNSTDAWNVWVRHEVPSYQSSARQAVTPTAAVEDPTNNRAYIASITITFTPSVAFTYRYFVVIRDGTGTLGNTTGSLMGYEDYSTTQTVTTSGKSFIYTPTL